MQVCTIVSVTVSNITTIIGIVGQINDLRTPRVWVVHRTIAVDAITLCINVLMLELTAQRLCTHVSCKGDNWLLDHLTATLGGDKDDTI